MSFTDLFSERADLYVSARPRYPSDLFAFVASKAPALGRTWDCGTGNGQAALSLAAHFSEVLATDPSQDQIAQATPAENIRYSVQRAEQTDFPARHFDAICVAQALHWFDFDAFFTEAKRVAKPGALFAAWGYSWPNVTPRFDKAFKASVRDILEPYWASQNRLLWNGYAEVLFPFPRLATPSFQISARWTFDQFMAYIGTWSATRKCMSEIGSGFLSDAVRTLQPLWDSREATREVGMPLCILAGYVH